MAAGRNGGGELLKEVDAPRCRAISGCLWIGWRVYGDIKPPDRVAVERASAHGANEALECIDAAVSEMPRGQLNLSWRGAVWERPPVNHSRCAKHVSTVE